MSEVKDITSTGWDQHSVVTVLNRALGKKFFDPVPWFIVAGTPAGVLVASLASGVAFDASTDEEIGTLFPLTADMDVTKAMTVRLHWSSAGTSATNGCVWDVNTAGIASETVAVAATKTSATTLDSATANVRILSEVTIAADTYAQTDSLIRLNVNRDANHASDTVAADVVLHAVELVYTLRPSVTPNA